MASKRGQAPLERCPWSGDDPLYQDYHDTEWGVPLRDDQALFALLQLEGMQAGLSWITVLRKREHMQRQFFKLKPRQLVAKGPERMAAWLQDPGLIRNRAKLNSLIGNAEAFLALEKAEGKGAFGHLLWDSVDGVPQQNIFHSLAEVPAHTPVSTELSKRLKKLGFRFVGPTIIYAFMQSAGLVNDHLQSCFRHAECRSLG